MASFVWEVGTKKCAADDETEEDEWSCDSLQTGDGYFELRQQNTSVLEGP